MWHKPHLMNVIADVLMLVAAAAFLAAVAVWLLRVPSLPVRQVVFAEALPHTTRAEVEELLPAALKGNFFSLNLEMVRRTLEQLPWVRKVEVRRVWPSRLEIRIEEHRPVARWGEAHGELVNSFGEVFAANLVNPELAALPMLSGPPGTSADVLKRYSELVGSFQKIGEKPVQVTLSPRLAWQLKLEHGMLVELGREQAKSPVGVRLQRFIEVYPEAIGKQAVKPKVVDLRYPNGYAIRVAGEVKGK